MAFPSSVEHVRLTRPRPGGQFKFRYDETGAAGPSGSHDHEAGLGLGGPALDFGRDGGARLGKERDTWKWEWIKQETASRDTLSLRTSKPVLQYPPSRSLDPDIHNIPTAKVAEAAVDYVRSLPDVSGYASISDLIVDELTEARKLPERDVYQGETLAVVYNARAPKAKVLLAFPVGQVGNHLCIFPFVPPSQSRRDRPDLLHFRPSAASAEGFPTAILQICSSAYQSGLPSDRQCTALMVRIHVSTIMLSVDPQSVTTATDSPDVRTARLGELTMAQTEGRRHVDMALDETSWCKALVVDEGGGLWLWEEEKTYGNRSLLNKSMKLTKIRGAISNERHRFYRVAFGSSPGTVLVMSATELIVVDYKDPEHSSTVLLQLTGHGRAFAAMEKSALARRATLTCVATNLEVLWVDELKAGSPVLTWKHDIAGSSHPDLSLTVLHVANRERILLSSKTTGLSVVFDVDGATPARSRHAPIILSTGGAVESGSTHAILPLILSKNREMSDNTTHLATLSSDGSLYISTLETGYSNEDVDMDSGDRPDLVVPEPMWTDDIRALAVASQDDRDEQIDEHDKALTKHKVYDMRWLWHELNEDHVGHSDTFTFDAFDRYLKELDAPSDNIATLGDLAREAVVDQEPQQRAHALVPLPVDHLSATQAISGIKSVEPGSYDVSAINTVQSDIITTTSLALAPPVEMEEVASTFASESHGRSAAERRRIDLDTRRLVLDLVLARTAVHSDSSLTALARTEDSTSASVDTPEALFQATQQLTLDEAGGGAKKIDFRFLAPHSDIQPEDSTPPDPGGSLDHDAILQTSSARRLMSAWTIGSNPTDYTWTDWRGPESRASTPIRRPVRPLPSPRATQKFAQSQGISGRYAPTIAASQAPHVSASTNGYTLPGVGLPLPSMRSSPPPVLHSSQSLQDHGAATQVERGPFGGRLEGKARKKPTKKRVGGF